MAPVKFEDRMRASITHQVSAMTTVLYGAVAVLLLVAASVGVVQAGRNVAVYLANAGAGSVVVRNRAEVLAALRRPRAGKRDR